MMERIGRASLTNKEKIYLKTRAASVISSYSNNNRIESLKKYALGESNLVNVESILRMNNLQNLLQKTNMNINKKQELLAQRNRLLSGNNNASTESSVPETFETLSSKSYEPLKPVNTKGRSGGVVTRSQTRQQKTTSI